MDFLNIQITSHSSPDSICIAMKTDKIESRQY